MTLFENDTVGCVFDILKRRGKIIEVSPEIIFKYLTMTVTCLRTKLSGKTT